jgi:hypothetical protein
MFIAPSFISFSVELNARISYGHVSRSLRTYPVIERTAPAFKFRATGDTEGLQGLLATRSISPYSVTGGGWTLLHVRALGLCHRSG